MGTINQFLTYKEVKIYLKVSTSTLHRYIKDVVNPLKVTHLTNNSPRIKLDDLTIWINKQDKLFTPKYEYCAFCAGVVWGFEDEESVAEYEISGLCQKCQNKVFKK